MGTHRKKHHLIYTPAWKNASKEYSSKDVKKMIEHQKKKHNWEFLFIGANIDAVETAKHFGIAFTVSICRVSAPNLSAIFSAASFVFPDNE